MRGRFFLPLLAAVLLSAPLTLFAAPHLNQPRKASAHRAFHRAYKSHSRRRHLRYHRAYYSRRHRAVLPAGPSSNRIEQIQAALARAGYYKADASGKWDDATVGAMKRFQEDQGLSSTGKIDALTLQKLGLGSDTAGLGAPHRPPPAPLGPSPNASSNLSHNPPPPPSPSSSSHSNP